MAWVSCSWNWMVWLIPLMYCLILFQWRMYKSSSLLTAFPSLPRIPLIGSLHMISGNMQTRMKKIMGIVNIIGKPTVFWISYISVIVLHKSEHILQAVHRSQDRDLLGIFENMLEDGILLARGKQWRYIRRIMNQVFTPFMLKKYLRTFNEQSNILVKRLEEKANTGIHIDVFKYAMDMNLDVITKNMLDYELKTQERGENEFSAAIKNYVALESKRFSNPILFFNLFFNIYLYLSGHKKYYDIMKELPKKIVKEKAREFKQNKEDNTKKEKATETLIDVLLQLHEEQPEFDEHHMCIEILTFIFTGSDSTATTISYICLLLAMHPEIQEKVYQEILSVFKDEDFVEVKMEHCNELRYMEQCIRETLRMFTLIPITFRQCSEPIKLHDEQVIPANCRVAFIYHGAHHDPSVFPDPEKFDPDRFSPQNYAKNAQNFMAFGVGHRACIGSKYAMLSLKTQLVHILRKYKLTTDMHISDIIYIVEMSSRSQNGYPVQFWLRRNEKFCSRNLNLTG